MILAANTTLASMRIPRRPGALLDVAERSAAGGGARATVLVALAAAAIAFAIGPTRARAQTSDPARIAAAVDSIVADALKDGRAAGMSVAVVRGADTIVLKGYGYADLELDVPTPPRAVYEIGSVTKQFTAAAVLLLQEQGKLSLDDDITRFLPDYPTRGHRVTIRRLLNHTSGIRSYTEMPVFREIAMLDLPRDTLVDLIGAEPFDFAPGEAMVYNNSAFFLLGLVIEKAAGMSYEEFVEQHLFAKAGMPDSRYCDERAIIERRANGYEMGPGGLRRAAYLDHTWPYAAGSLCSTAWDLVAWNQALHGGKLLSEASYRELTTPGTLNDGTRIRYGMGIGVDSLRGRPVLHHGGGIFGFVTDLKYFPEDRLSIAVLINTAGPVSPAAVSGAIAEVIYGPEPSVKAAPFTGDAADYAGEYRGAGRGGELVLTVAADSTGHGLTVQRAGTPRALPLTYVGGELFQSGRQRFTFVREGGRITALRADYGSVVSVLKRAQ